MRTGRRAGMIAMSMLRKTLGISRAAFLALALVFTLGPAPRTLAGQNVAVLFAGDYPGPPAFDDHLSLSRAALANNLRTWPDWTAPNSTIVELPGNSTGQQFLDAITPFTAGGATPLAKGDFFLLFYFGHGGFYSTDGAGHAASERPPAYNVWEEGLAFPGGTGVSDNVLTTTFKQFAPGVNKVFVNISCFSGGFWNGNNPGGIGDLEQVPNTLLMASSIEPLCTLTGNLPPRTWEPLYLRNLIANLARNGRASMTLAQWHYLSWVPGTVTGSRFDDPGDPASYAIQSTVDQEESLATDDPAEVDDLAVGPSPTLSIAYDATNHTAIISWPGEYLGSTLQTVGNLLDTNWLSIPNSTNTNSMVVNVSATAQFFRLYLTSMVVADLQMTMTGTPNSVNVGRPVTYTMTVTNVGTLLATNVTLVDMLAENLSLVSSGASQGTVSNSANAMDAELGTLNPGQGVTITVVAEPTTTGVVSNSAEVVSDSNENNWANNHAAVFTTVTGTMTNYTLNCSAGPNGTLFPLGTVSVPAGQRQWFSASSNPGYWVATWYVDGVPAQIGSSTFVLNNIQASHTVMVTFQPSQYLIEVIQTTNGTVAPTGPGGFLFVSEGGAETFVATPGPGSSVASWLVDSNLVQTGGTSYTLTNVQTNHNLQVIFTVPTPATLPQIHASSGPNGTITPGGSSYVLPGTNVIFTATPGPGYNPALWYLNNAPVQTNGLTYLLTNIQAPASVFVTFTTNQPGSTNPVPVLTNSLPPVGTAPIPPIGILPGGGTSIPPTEGNLIEVYGPVPDPCTLPSLAGPIAIGLTYNSADADGSWAHLDATVGWGWTHSFNTFLFSDGGQIFRHGPDGRTTRYAPQPDGVTYLPSPGYFDTVVSNGPGIFTLADKYQTVSTFATIAGTPFRVGDAVYRLVQIVDRNLNTNTLNYVGGLLTSVSDPYGRTTTFAYNSSNHLAAITQPAARVTTFQYDPSGGELASITDPAGKTITYTYDPLYQLSQKVDKDGRVFTYTYDAGKPVGISDEQNESLYQLSNATNWAVDPMALTNDFMRVYVPSTTSKTDGNGGTWRYAYDTNAAPTSLVDPDGAARSFTYDPDTRQLSSRTDANTNTTFYQHNAAGDLTSLTDPMGNITRYTYDPTFHQVTQETDPLGRVTTYTYDSEGDLAETVDPMSRITTTTWSNGLLQSTTDPLGHTTTYHYDNQGDRTNSTDVLGHVTSYTYDPASNLTSRTDADGHTYRYTYDPLNRRVTQVNPLGGTTTCTYDGMGDTNSVTDPGTNTTTYTYDARQRLVKMTDALTNLITYAYDADDNRTQTTDPDGHVTTCVYDAEDRQIKTIDALGYTTSVIYDPEGNTRTNIDARGFLTTYTYDPLDRVIQRGDPVTNSMGAPCVTTYGYATAGGPPCCSPTPDSSLLVAKSDPEGHITYYQYDAVNRLVAEIHKQGDTNDVIEPNDAVTTYGFDLNNNRTSVTNALGYVTRYQYDAVNRQTNMVNAAGDVTSTVYDPVGNATEVTAPNGNVTQYSYDALNRTTLVEDNGGGDLVDWNFYDADGNLVYQFNGDFSATACAYDALNRRTATEDPLGRVTTCQYDAVGDLTNEIDRATNSTRYIYDALNRRVQTVDALGNTSTTTYDGANNVVAQTDANGHVTTYKYDGMNREVYEAYPDGQPPRTCQYDGVGNVLARTNQNLQVTVYSYDPLYRLTSRAYSSGDPSDEFTYDLSGRMTSATRGNWVETFTYDAADRLTNSTQNGKSVGSVYNISGRTRIFTYPGGRVITNLADFRDRVGDIADPGSATPIVTYTYDDENNVLSRDYRNGAASTYTYNANNWLGTLNHTFSGNVPIAEFAYTYDDEGNQISETNLQNTGLGKSYLYDAVYRLTNYTALSPAIQKSWNLDPLGNWKSLVSNGTNQVRTHNAANELTSINSTPLSYDPNGNLTQDSTYLYRYDTENRLTTVLLASNLTVVAQYQYDALGRRVGKTASPAGSSSTICYYYDGDRAIEEQDNLGNTLATYVFGDGIDEVLTMTRGGVTYYYYQNSLGSAVAASANNTAKVSERYTYDAYGLPQITDPTGTLVYTNSWGAPHSPIGMPYLFTGRQLDEETALYFYRARYYDDLKGRFLQRDPSDYDAGMNLYAYADGNPASKDDPRGLAPRVMAVSTAEVKRLIKEITAATNSLTPPQLAQAQKLLKDLQTATDDDIATYNAAWTIIKKKQAASDAADIKRRNEKGFLDGLPKCVFPKNRIIGEDDPPIQPRQR